MSSARGKISTDNATEEEEALLVAAAYGDVNGLEQILRENPEINLSVEDSLGRTPIQLAVANEQIQVVEILLELCCLGDIYTALCNAIKREHQQLSQTIIRHEKYVEIEAALSVPGGLSTLGISDDSEGLHVPALVLAAQRNQFEIAKSLLLRGQTITRPHHVNCPCSNCVENHPKMDGYRLSRLRLETYKALASDCFLALNYKDPFYVALTMGRDLKRLARIENHFKEEYLHLSDRVSEFLVALLDHVDSNKELDVILNEPVPGRMDKGYARLKLALDYEEKKFVAHPSCQQLVAHLFFGEADKLVPSGRYLPQICFFLMTILFIVLYPVLAVFYLFAPRTKIADFLRIPYFRFVACAASMTAFLMFLLIFTNSVSAVIDPDNDEIQDVIKGFHYLLNKTGVEFTGQKNVRTYGDLGVVFYLIIIWIVGMFIQECQQLYQQGIQEYLSEIYNIIDFMNLSLYIAGFSCYVAGSFKIQESVKYFSELSSWDKLLQGDADAARHIYWIVADRRYWETYDPYVIFEGLFALANALSFCRLSYLLPASESVGPLKITLSTILHDVMRFGLIFIVIFMPFFVSMVNLYWYYSEDVLRNTSLHRETTENSIRHGIEASKAFAAYESTFKTLFWSLFGYGDPISPQLGPTYFNPYTETIGFLLYGGYHIVLVIIMLNMLIAMMSKSFEDIAEDEDHEWKFARAALYMDFIRKGGTLAVPFNVLPPPKLFILIPIRLYRRFCKRGASEELAASEDSAPTKVQNPATDHGKTNGAVTSSGEITNSNEYVQQSHTPSFQYLNVMRKVVDRFIGFTIQEEDMKQGNGDDLKQELTSFRFQMLKLFQEQAQVIRTLQDNTGKLEKTLKGNKVKIVDVSENLTKLSESLAKPPPASSEFGRRHSTREIGVQAPSWNRNPMTKL